MVTGGEGDEADTGESGSIVKVADGGVAGCGPGKGDPGERGEEGTGDGVLGEHEPVVPGRRGAGERGCCGDVDWRVPCMTGERAPCIAGGALLLGAVWVAASSRRKSKAAIEVSGFSVECEKGKTDSSKTT
jgi:hypothetical protein